MTDEEKDNNYVFGAGKVSTLTLLKHSDEATWDGAVYLVDFCFLVSLIFVCTLILWNIIKIKINLIPH